MEQGHANKAQWEEHQTQNKRNKPQARFRI